MSSVFSIALSALQAQSDAINVTGNNLANVNTIGFKASVSTFLNLVSESLSGGSGSDYGMGVRAPLNTSRFTQGAIENSSSPLSSAIQGSGFFVIKNTVNETLYTRDGDFVIDQNGLLQKKTGEKVQGWVADSNGLDTTAVPKNIVLPVGAVLPPNETKNFSFTANLNALGTAADNTNTFSQPMQVVDSIGALHDLTVTFTKDPTVPNKWTYDVTIDGGDLKTGTAGTPQSLLTAPGVIEFNSDGTMMPSFTDTTTTPATPVNTSPVVLTIDPTIMGGLKDGAGNMTMDWKIFDANGNGFITQYGQASAPGTSTQDGSQSAQLSQFSISTGGQIVARFSNGQTKVEAQLALASIINPESLANAGSNNFQATGNTSTPTIGLPQTGGRGQIIGGSLEASNVDLAGEFTNLIVYQRGYQASSRVITTADQLSQDLMNLIR
jgi:flagellar hook protein FlgE